MTYKFNPLNDWVLVKPEENKSQIGDSLHLADEAIKRQQKGEVVGVGKGRHGEELDVSIGDCLFFQANGNVPTDVDGVALLLVNKSQFLGLFL